MAFGLRFDALVMDQAASLKSSLIWNCLRESQPHLPIFIHSRDSENPGVGVGQPGKSSSPELILACLNILLNPVTPKPAACVPHARDPQAIRSAFAEDRRLMTED